jgi:hypothetical protein
LIAGPCQNALGVPVVLDGPVDGHSLRIYAEKILVPDLEPSDIDIVDDLCANKVERGAK